MAMLFEWFLLEQKPRVQQPPSCERSLALKNRVERENRQGYFEKSCAGLNINKKPLF
jgi:hypothetical protein